MMGVQLARFRAVVGGMRAVARSGLGVMRRGIGIVFLVMFGGQAVMMRRFFVMPGGGMVMRAGWMFVRHEVFLLAGQGSTHPACEINMSTPVVCTKFMCA
jgi:hypothetical protein